MPYDSNLTRSLVSALQSEEMSRELIKGIMNESAAMNYFRRVTMSRNQTRMPVLAALPNAYFVNGDTGLKQTTDMSWANKYLNAEEIAVIVPIPEAVLDDVDYDIWGDVRPKLVDAGARVLDNAALFEVNKPASWPTGIVAGAVAAGHVAVRGTNSAAQGGVAADISDAFAYVEADGYDVSAIFANRVYKGLLRDARDGDGVRLSEVTSDSAYGVPISYPMRGLWPTGASATELIAGDPNEAILGIRQDFTFKVLDQAVLTDSNGDITHNLPQQDMIALRMVFRCAFQVANTINYDNANEATRYPFAVINAPA